MAEDKQILAVFDFDGTLSKGHLWIGIARHNREKRINRFAIYLYLLSHMPFWWASRLGLYDEKRNMERWGEDMPMMFKGLAVEDARQAFVWIIDNYFAPLLRSDVVNILKDHKKKGHTVMLLSGMFMEFLELVAQMLGVDYIIGTRLEIQNGIYSGRIIKPLCFSENKARYLKEFITEKKLDVDLSRSYAYADGIYDVPVLRLFGHPVATYPDKELYQLALHNQWSIINHAQAHETRA
jgi:HAD superfamily hydrolase (TIGR01490 family)